MPMKTSSTRNSSPLLMLKQEFLKKWKRGLQKYTTTFNKQMTIPQRKTAVKRSSDVAIAAASARINASARWSRALMANPMGNGNKIIACSKKVVRRRRAVVGASIKARQLVKRRTRVLRRLVPGGERMDRISLMKETLDYIASLKVQVEVMRSVVAAVERLDQQEIWSSSCR